MDNKFIAVIVPVVLLLCGVAAKKIVRGAGWQRHDFFLGIEFTLSATTAGLIQLFDLGQQSAQVAQQKITGCGLFLVTCFFMLLMVISTHQEWAKKDERPNNQIFWLGLVANLIGASLMVIFILRIK